MLAVPESLSSWLLYNQSLYLWEFHLIPAQVTLHVHVCVENAELFEVPIYLNYVSMDAVLRGGACSTSVQCVCVCVFRH